MSARRPPSALLLVAGLLAGLATCPAGSQVSVGARELLSASGAFPAVALDGGRGLVSVWVEFNSSGQEIVGRRLPARGAAEAPFLVNSRIEGLQSEPGVAVNPRGNFMVVWKGGGGFPDTAGGDGDGEGVFGQVFGPSGGRLGPQRRLNEGTRGDQRSPAVAAAADGSFIAVWQDRRASPWRILARRYSAHGIPLGGERRMAAGGEFNLAPRVAAFPGGFVVGWTEGVECSGGRSGGSEVALARFDLAGRALGKVLRIGSAGCGVSGHSLAGLAGSRAGVVAAVRAEAGHFLLRLDPAGNVVDPQTLGSRPICPSSRCAFLLSAAMDDSGWFVVAWDVSRTAVSEYRAQVFSPRGSPLTPRLPLGDPGSSDLPYPAVALAHDGNFVAVLGQRDEASEPAESRLYIERFHVP